MADTISIFKTPVGPLRAHVSDGRLNQLSFHNRAVTEPSHSFGNTRNTEVLSLLETQIGEYFARTRTQFDVPLEIRGPEFHRRVWDALLSIPYGETVSYGYLAAMLGVPVSARAVGAANGANPIVIIVPCHRVIGADGSLIGYGGGLDRKRILLDLESERVPLAF